MPFVKQRLVSANCTYACDSREQAQDARALLEKELRDVELAATYIRHRINLLLPVPYVLIYAVAVSSRGGVLQGTRRGHP